MVFFPSKPCGVVSGQSVVGDSLPGRACRGGLNYYVRPFHFGGLSLGTPTRQIPLFEASKFKLVLEGALYSTFPLPPK